MNGSQRAQQLAASHGARAVGTLPKINGFEAERRIAEAAEQAHQREALTGGRRTREQIYVATLMTNPQAYQQYKMAKRQKAFRIAAGID